MLLAFRCACSHCKAWLEGSMMRGGRTVCKIIKAFSAERLSLASPAAYTKPNCKAAASARTSTKHRTVAQHAEAASSALTVVSHARRDMTPTKACANAAGKHYKSVLSVGSSPSFFHFNISLSEDRKVGSVHAWGRARSWRHWASIDCLTSSGSDPKYVMTAAAAKLLTGSCCSV